MEVPKGCNETLFQRFEPETLYVSIGFLYTLKSLSSLLGDFFREFWPGFLALDQNGDGTDGRDGRDGRTDF